MNRIACFCLLFFAFTGLLRGEENQPTVLLAVLAKNKAHVLPAYLRSIENLDYDKKLISVYINTNNNQDATKEVLEEWVKANESKYRSIIFESHTIEGAAVTRPHEWTGARFKALALIRNKSMQKTKECGCDYYFVVDCDNFITPCTLKELLSHEKPIIAPLLRAIPEAGDVYSNYFCDVTETGYYKENANYIKILSHSMLGTFKVPVVHCTYLIQASEIDKLSYIDGTEDYEFVIFSRQARKNGVGQYICNEKDFGTLLHFHNDLTLEEEAERVKGLRELQ